jgi:hypothetical protein
MHKFLGLFALPLTLVFFPNLGNCEYRVYQYLIRDKNMEEGPTQIDISTLDPVGYLAYHGGSRSLDLSLLRTWICKGNTSYITTCDPPKKPEELIGKSP